MTHTQLSSSSSYSTVIDPLNLGGVDQERVNPITKVLIVLTINLKCSYLLLPLNTTILCQHIFK